MTEPPKPSGLFMLGIKSDPLPMHPEMFNLVGQIVVHWSRIESAIDHDLHTLRRYGVVKKLAEVVPHTFGKKLELWRRSIRSLYPRISEYQDCADAFLEDAQNVVKLRNHIIHGVWTLNENEKGEFLVSNHRYHKGKWRHDKWWAGIESLQTLLGDVQMLDNEITSFTATRMLHGGLGLLRATPSPSPDRQAQPTPATREKPQEPPESSEE